MRRRIIGFLIFSFLFFYLNGCGFNHPKTLETSTVQNGPAQPQPQPQPPGTVVSFSSLSQNIFLPKCSSCHGSSIGNYNYLISQKYVIPGSAANSVLYQDVSTGDMPKNRPPLSSSEVSSIYEWIQAGAKNN